MMNQAFKNRSIRITVAILICIKLWLASAQALYAIGPSFHDDLLFLRLANKFLGGEWLGSYNVLTLAKGPAFPIFIATTVVTGIPLPLAQHLMYLLGCWLVVRTLRPLLPNDWWALALFGMLWWQPMSFEMTVLGRVMRQNLYTPLTLLVFAGLAALYTRASAPQSVRVSWAVLLGLAGAGVWLTREESIWVIPATVMLVGIAAAQMWRKARSWRRAVQTVGIAVSAALLPIIAVCAMNARNYGWWGTVEFRAPEFIAAYGALNRVQLGPEIPCVPLTRASREALYTVSPAFAELEQYLEGPNWASASEYVTHLPKEEREIAGGWWMWALRDAVAAAGHAHSAAEALEFYQRLANEVNAACDRGDLPAGPPRATLFPPWQSVYTQTFFHELPRFVLAVATFSGGDARTPPSIGDADSLRLFRDVPQWFISPAPDAPVFDTTTSTIARSYRVAALQIIARVTRWSCALLVAFGTVAWVAGGAGSILRRKWPSYPWWFALACAGSVLGIVLINLLVHVTSFPQFSPGAFAQAYPLILIFAFISIADLAMTWVRRRPFTAYQSSIE